MTDNCIFCKIIRGEIPCSKVYEDEKMLVFKDVQPMARVHLLAVPKTHFKLISEADGAADVLGHIFEKIPSVAVAGGCKNGFRLIVNQGSDAAQSVPHLHVHILGGEPLPEKII